MIDLRQVVNGSSARAVARMAMLALCACSPEPAPIGDHEPTHEEQAKVDFDRQVRPILAARCFSCHGPDTATRQAHLRVDQASGLFEIRDEGRPPVVVKGNPEASLLYLRISADEEPMPPLEVKKPLSAQEIELIRLWIEQGADFADHWFLGAPARPAPPTVKHAGWVKNPVDAFIAQGLEAVGLEPAPQAEPRALARRVSLALTGLPPSVADVEAFAADPSDAAYAALVDRLLDSSAFGEQRAHFWLDAARYADTHGFHMDNYRSIWPYRDWVIAAFNTGKPFDQFTIEQLAGDLLPNATTDQKVATGFIRCAMSSSEGGSIEAEFEAIAAKDRVDTLAAVWLGLTVGCAACHDHKFDPVSQKDFYRLAAYFRNTTQFVFDLNALDPPPVVAMPDGTPTLVTGEAATPPTAFVLTRGQYDQPGELVPAGVPAALPPLPASAPNNRLGLAQWLMSPEHPLTARVTANRFWSEMFGVGIVRTAHDFGSTGEVPSNPPLLDWLAVELRESGWNVKALLRTLVTSATYRQSAVVTPEKLALDPENRLLSRGPRFRFDAELVRDLALATSGLLVPTIGGASVKPYQPDGVWESVTPLESNTFAYTRDTGDALYRRSLYTFRKRLAAFPSLELFDAPVRTQSVVHRARTNTPLQALVTLNDVQFVEAAKHLAALALAAAATTPERLDFIAQRVLSRRLVATESTLLETSLATLQSQYAAAPDQAAALLLVGDRPAPAELSNVELAAWTMLASTFLNLDEALNQ
ncbi:MAG TPA: PSD1 and planctomycete cytochrome C domain-containing protein [Polyangiaceae bacterium]|nr:PSD1 and planctomycete cytochrome C domain-containing protein [Polyangiaceae bacterium]